MNILKKMLDWKFYILAILKSDSAKTKRDSGHDWRTDGRTDRRTDGRTDGQTDGLEVVAISPVSGLWWNVVWIEFFMNFLNIEKTKFNISSFLRVSCYFPSGVADLSMYDRCTDWNSCVVNLSFDRTFAKWNEYPMWGYSRTVQCIIDYSQRQNTVNKL